MLKRCSITLLACISSIAKHDAVLIMPTALVPWGCWFEMTSSWLLHCIPLPLKNPGIQGARDLCSICQAAT